MPSNEGPTTPFEEAHWELMPSHTVLVVIDPQNDFLHAEGWYACQGIDISHMQRCIEPVKTLLADALSEIRQLAPAERR